MINASKPGSRRPGIFFEKERKVIAGKKNMLTSDSRVFRPNPQRLLWLNVAVRGLMPTDQQMNHLTFNIHQL